MSKQGAEDGGHSDHRSLPDGSIAVAEAEADIRSFRERHIEKATKL